MLLSAVCILMCLLFVFCVRKHKGIISALIAIETIVLIAMLAMAYLSSAGSENAYVFILGKAISTKVTIFGIKVSSFMAIQAIIVLLACFISLYGIFHIVKKVLGKNRRGLNTGAPEKEQSLYFPDDIFPRKVFMLYCRMNN